MTLFRTVTPLPDENLAGLVARAAGANIYPYARDVLALAGLDHIRASAVTTKGMQRSGQLAEALGTTEDSLDPLFIHRIDEGNVNFFGTQLHGVYREPNKRRVSPAALRAKAYVRAIWSVRPISFDPSTKETLIEACPVCGKDLGFTKTWGVEFCEHCVAADEYGLPRSFTDLRDFPQPIVQVDDVEALDYAVSLIDPAATDRRYSPHVDLQDLNRGELFDLVVSIGGALVMNRDPASFTMKDSSYRGGVTTLAPRDLAAAGRAVLSWPEGFVALCDNARKDAGAREGDYGLFKEFGALGILQRDKFLPSKARQAIKAQTGQAMSDLPRTDGIPRKTSNATTGGAYIGSRQLRRLVPISATITTRLAAHPSVITHRASEGPMAPIQFSTWQVASIVDHYMDLVSESSLGVTLGLPPDAVRDLANGLIRDHFSPEGKIAADLVGGGTYYSKQSADDLVDILTHGIAFKKLPPGYVPFLEAMLMFPSGRRPWMPMMDAIMYQRVDAVFRKNVPGMPKIKNLFGAVAVKGIEDQRDDILWRHSLSKPHDIDRVSGVAANLMLGIYNHHVFMACDRAELIEVDKKDGTASYASVLDFAAKHIFGNEAAVRSRTKPQELAGWLRARDVMPAYSFGMNGGDIYLREQVEPHLEMKA